MVFGEQAEPVRSEVPAPDPISTLLRSRAMVLTASATAEFGTSTIMSTPPSNHWRAMAAPMSVLFWWSPDRISTGAPRRLPISSAASRAAMTEPMPWKSA